MFLENVFSECRSKETRPRLDSSPARPVCGAWIARTSHMALFAVLAVFGAQLSLGLRDKVPFLSAAIYRHDRGRPRASRRRSCRCCGCLARLNAAATPGFRLAPVFKSTGSPLARGKPASHFCPDPCSRAEISHRCSARQRVASSCIYLHLFQHQQRMGNRR